jgi:hypothetical protein
MNKFEARNPKPETNLKIKCSKFKTKASRASCFGYLDFSHSDLFRISIFEFRIYSLS